MRHTCITGIVLSLDCGSRQPRPKARACTARKDLERRTHSVILVTILQEEHKNTFYKRTYMYNTCKEKAYF